MPTIHPPAPTIEFDVIEPEPQVLARLTDFGIDMAAAFLEHPQQVAAAHARAERASRPAFEQSELYKTHVAFYRDALARIPAAITNDYRQARQRFEEVDSALNAIDQELANVRANRPSAILELDKWSHTHAATQAKRETLLLMHADSAAAVINARNALIDSLIAEVEQQREAASVAREAAQQALQEARRVVNERYEAERHVSRYATRLRDGREADDYVSAALKEI